MRTIPKRALGAVALVAFAAACSDNGGESLNLAEKTALSNALTNSGALTAAGPAAGFGAVAVFMLPNIGSLTAGTSAANALNASIQGLRAASYEGAVGFQIIYTSGASSETFTGVVGWTGLNVTANTVDEVVAAGALTATATPVANGSNTTIDGNTGFGAYWVRTPAASYSPGSTGNFVLTSSSFTGEQVDCASLAEVAQCSYRTGSMTGQFNFTADRVGATGTYTQTPVTFSNMPAVRITIVE